MKKITLLIIGVICLQITNAQDTTTYSGKRNEINIGYFNLFQLSSINNLGIGYKHAFGNGAIRLGVSVNYYYSDFKEIGDTSNNSALTIIPRIGYEFRQNYNWFVVYYGVDACLTINKQINNYQSGNNLTKNTDSGTGFGLSPFIGLKYFINKCISISTETNFNFLYTKGKNTYLSNGKLTDNSDTKSMSARLSPLGIVSLNLHF